MIICIIAILLIEKLYVKSFINVYQGEIETPESITNRASWMLFILSLAYSSNEFISSLNSAKDFKIIHLIIPVLFILNAIAIIFTTGIFVEIIFILIIGVATLIILKVQKTTIIEKY